MRTNTFKTWVLRTAKLPLSSPDTNPEDKSETSETPYLAILLFYWIISKNQNYTGLENYHNSE